MTPLPSRDTARRASRLRRMLKLADDPQLDKLLNAVANNYALFPRTSHETVLNLTKILYRHLATNADLAAAEKRIEALEKRLAWLEVKPEAEHYGQELARDLGLAE